MNFLRTSRVVLIDDEPEEVLPVLEALGRLSVGCTYLPGDRQEDLPRKPLHGIRLVVLDMHLGAAVPGGDQAKTTATVFHRVVSPDHGPLVVLLWSKHPEDLAKFREALFVLEPKFKSILLVSDLEKPPSMTPGEGKRLVRKMRKLAKEWIPMNLLWEWEQLAHDAASATTGLVAGHVTESVAIDAADDDNVRKCKWLARLKVILRQLATAAGGQAAKQKTAHSDLLETFLALHTDRVEHGSKQFAKVEIGDLFADPPGKITPGHAAKLNAMLLIAPPGAETGELRPGDVYLWGPKPEREVLFKRTGINVRRLAEEIIGSFEKDVQCKKHMQDAVAKNATPAARRLAEARASRRKSTLLKKCRPLLAELTPTCDFSQQTRCVVRLAGGVLVPGEMAGMIKKKNSLKQFEAVVIPGKTGVWTPVFCARFHFSLPKSKKLAKTRPDFRLRGPVLVDLRNWYSAQSARSGYLSVSCD
jgi:hypothetical protein